MKSLRNLTVIALTAVLAFVFSGCSSGGGDDPVLPLPPAHVHAYSDSWTSNETHHWHAATCEHDVKKDLDVHSAAAELGKDATGHWKVCGVCNASFETTSHTWDHEDFQLDAASGKEIKTCTVCGFVADKNHAHTEDNGTVTPPTCVTKGVKTYKCTVCDKVLRIEEIPATGHTEDSGTVTKNVTLDTDGERTYKCTVCGNKRTEPITKPKLYETPIDVETGLAATKYSKYIYFGVFPKTVAAENITVDENVSVKMGADTYYKGSDGEYYAKVMEDAYSTGTEYKYSDGTQAKQSSSNSYRWFKVEPIKWKVITKNYKGKCLLLAEDILTANIPYHPDTQNRVIAFTNVYVYPSNYKYSAIRAYLNGKYESYDTQLQPYKNKGFLQTAFTVEAQNLIAVTTVDNSAASTTDAGNNFYEATDYACTDTEDKIFLLSMKEATSYGFPAFDKHGEGNARIRKPTDYAMANYAYQNSTSGYGGYWWLRSPPYNNRDYARYLDYDGLAYSSTNVKNTRYGVVPALSISLQ